MTTGQAIGMILVLGLVGIVWKSGFASPTVVTKVAHTILAPNVKAQALLFASAVRGDTKGLERALAEGASIDAEFGVSTALAAAAQNGQLDAMAYLLAHGADINHRYGLPLRCALHDAVLKGRLDSVKFLIEHGANVNLGNKRGRTALFYAVNPPPPLEKPKNSEEIAAYLVTKGARQ